MEKTDDGCGIICHALWGYRAEQRGETETPVHGGSLKVDQVTPGWLVNEKSCDENEVTCL